MTMRDVQKNVQGCAKWDLVKNPRLGLLQKVLRRCMKELIKAYRAGDWERVKVLSQCRALLRKRLSAFSYCGRCGIVVSQHAVRCRLCYLWERYYPQAIGKT